MEMRADEAIFAFLYLLTYVGILSFIFLSVARHYWIRNGIRRGKRLPAFAEALGGSVSQDPSVDTPSVLLKVAGARAHFTRWLLTGSPSGRIVSAIEIRIGSPGYLEATSLRSRRYPSRGARLQTLRPYAGFHFVSSDPAWANRLLDAGVEAFLNDVERMFRRPLRLQISPGRILLDVESALSPKNAVALVREAERLVGLLRGEPGDAGIEILQEGFEPSGSRCPVCRLETSDGVVLCGRCHSPHHEDCWSYAGCCAIMGCGSKQVA